MYTCGHFFFFSFQLQYLFGHLTGSGRSCLVVVPGSTFGKTRCGARTRARRDLGRYIFINNTL